MSPSNVSPQDEVERKKEGRKIPCHSVVWWQEASYVTWPHRHSSRLLVISRGKKGCRHRVRRTGSTGPVPAHIADYFSSRDQWDALLTIRRNFSSNSEMNSKWTVNRFLLMTFSFSHLFLLEGESASPKISLECTLIQIYSICTTMQCTLILLSSVVELTVKLSNHRNNRFLVGYSCRNGLCNMMDSLFL